MQTKSLLTGKKEKTSLHDEVSLKVFFYEMINACSKLLTWLILFKVHALIDKNRELAAKF